MPAPTGPTAARMRSRIASVGVGGRVVADEERAAIEVQAAGERRAGRRCRWRWCSARTRAAAAPGAPTAPRRGAARRRRSSVQRRVVEAAAALEGVLAPRPLERVRTPRRRPGACAARQRVEVVVAHAVVGGVVQRADEPGVGGDVDAALAHAVAHVGAVGHVGEEPRVGAAAPAAAGAAVVRRLVRVVEAGRAVAEERRRSARSRASGRCW